MISSPRRWATRAKGVTPTAFLPTKRREPFSGTPVQPEQDKRTLINVEELLSQPTWSVSSLLPQNAALQTSEVSPKQLHHLLRLSALPPPKDEAAEAQMLSILSSQLHFVKEIQRVDTNDIEPLRSLRDETAAGGQEAEMGLEELKHAFAMEEVRGRRHRRIRRRNMSKEGQDAQEWDVLGTAERKVGRYFVVDGGKDG